MLRRNNKKKAQIMGQIFVYTFAALIFVMVLIYGYKSTAKFAEWRDYVATIELKTEITSIVHGVAGSRTMVKKPLLMPSSVHTICFIDLSHQPPDPALCANFPQICSSWQDRIPKNVFFIPSINLNINIGNITLADKNDLSKDYLCLNVTNEKIYIRLEGQGDKTKIRPYDP